MKPMTTASSPASNSLRLLLCLACLGGLGGCVDDGGNRFDGPTSLAVTITSPEELGSEEARLPDGQRAVSIHVEAIDALGQPAAVNGSARVYLQFLGTLSPDPLGTSSLGTVQLVDGQGDATFTLEVAYGRTQVWVEEPDSLITGVSQDVWFRDPWLEDANRPENEMSLSALSRGPLEGKQVVIRDSHFGASGALVVTGVYAQGYTVSDVNRQSGETVPYGHALIFTFGRPRALDGTEIAVGSVVAEVSGGVKDFNGLTEFNFPTTDLVARTPAPELLPAPAPIDAQWLTLPLGPTGMINLERLESALVEVDDARLCAFDSDFDTYGQWKLDVGNGCSSGVMNVITKGQVSDFDPTTLAVGSVLPRVIGTLKAVNIGNFNVWIIQPRTLADLTVN
jgi:hypothetical protein